MRRVLVVALAAVAAMSAGQQFPKYGVRLLDSVGLDAFTGSPTSAAAIYGYTAPSGREYATIGLRNGTGIVEITDPENPVVVAHIPGPTTLWHENVVLGNYCYSVSDSTGIGIQVIDLSDVDNGNVTVPAVYTGNETATVHTIEADAQTQRLFANGGTRNFAILDASNPTALTEIGRWTTKYVHDSVIRNYTSGPWAGRQIAFLCCGTAGLYIADVTNAASIVVLGTLNYYPGAGSVGKFYCHSASLTPDNRYLLVNDEFDEKQNLTASATTIVVDVQDLENPTVVNRFRSGVNTIDHNSMLRNGFLFLAAYKAGVRIYDARNAPNLSEVGYFDSYPSATDDQSYDGDWGVFANFPSGNIVISDINTGLYILDPSEAIGLGAPLIGANIAGSGAMGTLADLKRSDNKWVSFTNLASPITVFAETTISPRTTLRVTLEALGSETLSLYLRNQLTQTLDLIGSFSLTGTEETFIAPLKQAAAYVSATGQIECMIQPAGVGSRTGIRNRIDMVRFDVLP